MQTTTAAAAAMMFPSGVHVVGADVIRVGVIGTGGRGTGAIANVLMAADGRRDHRARRSQSRPARAVAARTSTRRPAAIRRSRAKYKAGFKVDRRARLYRLRRLQEGARRAGRPRHSGDAARIPAAASRGRGCGGQARVHGEARRDRLGGIRSVLATYEAARKKNLGIVAGTQRRHQAEYLATIKRLHDGAIGDIVSGQVFWNQGGLWNHERQPKWSDTEWQIRNWLYFTWLSGDHIVEQHVHNIDVANWVMGGHPVRAIGVGGRQQRTDPKYGHIYDHFAVDFEYPSGARVMSMCRQIEGTPQPHRRELHRHEGQLRRVDQDHRARARGRIRSRRSRSTPTCRSTPISSPASAPASRSTS